MTNRKGGLLGFTLLFIFLIIMWAIFLSTYFSLAGDQAIAAGATGLEAFLWTNLNLWFFFCLIIVALVYIRLGGEQ